MPNSLRARIKQFRYRGQLLPHQAKRIIVALDVVDAVKALPETETIKTLKEMIRYDDI